MIYAQQINLPVIVEYMAIAELDLSALFHKYNLNFRRLLVYTGVEKSRKYACELVAANDHLQLDLVSRTVNSLSFIEQQRRKLLDGNYDLIVGVGGGRVLDAAKYLAAVSNRNFLAIPTQISTDSVASPIAVLRGEHGENTYSAKVPMGIVIDVEALRRSARSYIAAGIGDLISNRSALLDWDLAIAAGYERANYFARALSTFSFTNVAPDSLSHVTDTTFLRRYADSIVMAGIAMAVSGNTRPCSGAEHLLCHAVNDMLDCPYSHGFLVGSATPFCLHLHGQGDPGVIALCCELGFRLDFMDAFAPDIRVRDVFERARTIREDRYTILSSMSCAELVVRYGEFVDSLSTLDTASGS